MVCVEVEYRDGLLGYFVSEVVAGADYLTALNSRSRHPYAHRPWIVIASHASL